MLKFNIAGIEEEVMGSKIASVSGMQGIVIAGNKVSSAGEFEVLTNAKLINTSGGKVASRKVAGVLAVTTPMGRGVKYRFILRDKGTNTVVKNIEVSSGTDPQIKLDAGKTYLWYVVSVNSTTAGSAPGIDERTGVTADKDIASKEILYNRGEINLVYGDNNLQILLKRHRLRIDVDLGSAESSVSSGTVDVGISSGSTFGTSIVRTGALNVFTGEYTNVSIPQTTARSLTSENVNGVVIKRATFYTVVANANEMVFQNTLKVRLDNVRLANNTVIIATVPVNNNLFRIREFYGKIHNISVNLIKSQSVLIRGTRWAESNLVYVPTSPDNKYQFKGNNNSGAGNATNEYWNWLSETPTGRPGDVISGTDPCTKVLPEDTWRMPNTDEMNDLFIVNTNRVLSTSPRRVTWTGENGKDLVFGVHGYRDVNASSITDAVNGYYRYLTNNPLNGFISITNASVANLHISGNWESRRGLTIRCVRK
ncbi:hypothetical protein ACV0BM_012975 [Elizabethkingia meningoseptica]